MALLRLRAKFVPWSESAPGYNDDASVLRCALRALPGETSIGELMVLITKKFEDFFPNLGQLRIKYLKNGYGDLLDSDDCVSDYFVDRTQGLVDERDWTVNVYREPPKADELRNVNRSQSIAPESSARPPKHPRSGLLLRALHGNLTAHGRDEPVHKRRRLDVEAFRSTIDADRPIRSRERDLPEQETYGQVLAENDLSTYVVADSQRSPQGNPPNMYGTPVSLSTSTLHGFQNMLQKENSSEPDSPCRRSKSRSTAIPQSLQNANRETPKTESPEPDNLMYSVPLSNPGTPGTVSSLRPADALIVSVKPSRETLPRTTAIPQHLSRRTTSPESTSNTRFHTPDAQRVLSASRCGMTTAKSLIRPSSGSGFGPFPRTKRRQVDDIWDPPESDDERPLGLSKSRNAKGMGSNHHCAMESSLRPRPFSDFNRIAANMISSDHSISRGSSLSHAAERIRNEVSNATTSEMETQEINAANNPVEKPEDATEARSSSIGGTPLSRQSVGELVSKDDSQLDESLDEISDGDFGMQNRQEEQSEVEVAQMEHAAQDGEFSSGEMTRISILDAGSTPNMNTSFITRTNNAASVDQPVLLNDGMQMDNGPQEIPGIKTTRMSQESGEYQAPKHNVSNSTPDDPETSVLSSAIVEEVTHGVNQQRGPEESRIREELKKQRHIAAKAKAQGKKLDSREEWSVASKKGRKALKDHLEKEETMEQTPKEKARHVSKVDVGKGCVVTPSTSKERGTSITRPVPGKPALKAAQSVRSDSAITQDTFLRNGSSDIQTTPSAKAPSSPVTSRRSTSRVSFAEDMVIDVDRALSATPAAVVTESKMKSVGRNPSIVKTTSSPALRDSTRASVSRSTLNLGFHSELKELLRIQNQTKLDAPKDKGKKSVYLPPLPPPKPLIREHANEDPNSNEVTAAMISDPGPSRSRSTSKATSASARVGDETVDSAVLVTEPQIRDKTIALQDGKYSSVDDAEDSFTTISKSKSRSMSRSPAKEVSSSASSAAFESGSETDSGSASEDDGDDRQGAQSGQTQPLATNDDLLGRTNGRTKVLEDRSSPSDSEDSKSDSDDGQLPPVKSSLHSRLNGQRSPKPVLLSGSTSSRESADSAKFSVGDEAGRQLQWENRQSMEPYKSSQMQSNPRTPTIRPSAATVRSAPKTPQTANESRSTSSRYPTMTSLIREKRFPNAANKVTGFKMPLKNASGQPMSDPQTSGFATISDADSEEDSSSEDEDDDDDEETVGGESKTSSNAVATEVSKARAVRGFDSLMKLGRKLPGRT